MVTRARAGHEQHAPLPLQILGVGDRVYSAGGHRRGSRHLPSATPMAAIAWNSRPFMPCMVPARTAFFLPLGRQRDGRDSFCLQRFPGLA